MLPKQFVLPKKGFGSSLASPRQMGLVRSHSVLKSNDQLLTHSFPIKKERRIQELLRNVSHVQEMFQDNKKEIMNELNMSQKALSQHIQGLVVKYFSNMQRESRSRIENLKEQVILLKSEIKEKDVANQGLVEENLILAQKNEALSKLVSNGLNQINETNSFEYSNASFFADAQNNNTITVEGVQRVLPLDKDLLLNVVENIREELNNARQIALEENRKFLAASKKLEEVLKERQHPVEIKETPDSDLMQKYKKQHNELEENYRKSIELLEQNNNLLLQEKEQLSEQLQSTRAEFEAIVKEYKRKSEKITTSLEENGSNTISLKEKIENMFAYFDITNKKEKIPTSNVKIELPDAEKEALKRELETTRTELEEHKAKLIEKLQIDEENYSAHLDIINELHFKMEVLVEDCEQLRKLENKENQSHRSPNRERNSVSRESADDLFIKFEGLEKNLHSYIEERKHLLDENGKLLIELNELKSKILIENNEKESQPDQACNQITELNQEISKLTAENDQQKVHILSADKELVGLKSQNADLEGKNKENVLLLEQAQKEKGELQQTVLDLHTKEKLLTDEIQTLQNNIQEYKNTEKDKVEKEAEEKNAQDFAVQIEILQLKLEDALEDCTEYKRAKEDLEEQLKRKNEEIQFLESQLENNQRELELKVQGYQRLMDEFKEGRATYGSAEDEMFEKYQQLQEICDKFELKCEKLTQQKEALQRELDVIIEENTRLREENS